jgi:hypothetical protein
LTPGHWYYITSTYEVNGDSTTINSYLADVTAGETALHWLVEDAVASGTLPLSSPLGIGAYFHNGTFDHAWSGSLDEIAFYGRALDAAELQLHLDALYAAPIPGDANGDGYVDALDAAKLAENWGLYDETFGFDDGDFNGDHYVNAADASTLAANWGSTGESTAAVPEPTTLGLLLAGIVWLGVTARRGRNE